MNSATKALSSKIVVPTAIDIPDGLWKRKLAVTDFWRAVFLVMRLPRRRPGAKSCLCELRLEEVTGGMYFA